MPRTCATNAKQTGVAVAVGDFREKTAFALWHRAFRSRIGTHRNQMVKLFIRRRSERAPSVYAVGSQ